VITVVLNRKWINAVVAIKLCSFEGFDTGSNIYEVFRKGAEASRKALNILKDDSYNKLFIKKNVI
jgi:hypothetical protein